MNNRTPLITALILISSLFFFPSFFPDNLSVPKATTEPKLELVSEYGLLCIKNELPYDILYYYRWGENGEWGFNIASANSAYWHWWEYNNHNHTSPNFYIRFDSDFGNHNVFLTRRLKRHQAHFIDCESGYEYCFNWSDIDGCFDIYDCE